MLIECDCSCSDFEPNHVEPVRPCDIRDDEGYRDCFGVPERRDECLSCWRYMNTDRGSLDDYRGANLAEVAS